MPKCGKCGGNLGGRGYKSCRTCSSNGKRKSAHSRHANHKKNKRERTDTYDPTHSFSTGLPIQHADAPPPTCCANCSFLFNNTKAQLDSAQRSEVEVQRCRNNGAVKVNKWNLGQVKQILQPHMLKLSGGAYKQQLCTKCLVIKFGVGKKWPRRYFNKCKDKQQATQTTKEAIEADSNFDVDRVILPFNVSSSSKKKYLKSLDDDDVVHVEKVVSFNSGAGKARGKAAIFANVHRLFNQWVHVNSTLNGRTKCGHGAMNYLDSRQKSKNTKITFFFTRV